MYSRGRVHPGLARSVHRIRRRRRSREEVRAEYDQRRIPMRLSLSTWSKGCSFAIYDPESIVVTKSTPTIDVEEHRRRGNLIAYSEEAGDSEPNITVLVDEPIDPKWEQSAQGKATG